MLLRTGDVFELQANYEDALRSYRQALVISEQLARADASNTLLLSNVALTHYRIGNLIFRQGNFERALEFIRGCTVDQTKSCGHRRDECNVAAQSRDCR